MSSYSHPILIRLFFLMLLIGTAFTASASSCHYTCSTCQGPDYYQCQECTQNRGTEQSFMPISGMCYCSGSTDENEAGQCMQSDDFNYNNKATIAVFIGLALFCSLLAALATGFRHFLVKTIEDIQEISIIVFVNLYFPQQFDIFLARLYRFNISSYTFQALSAGSLYEFAADGTVYSLDGQNIRGKYQLLYKTANFFSNTFTWLLVFICALLLAIGIKVVRNKLKAKVVQAKAKKIAEKGYESDIKKTEESFIATEQKNDSKIHLCNNRAFEEECDEIPADENIEKVRIDRRRRKRAVLAQDLPEREQEEQREDGEQGIISESAEVEKISSDEGSTQERAYRIFNRLHNMTWFGFFIVFFYLSLMEININIFSQIANLTFSSSFAAFGALSSAIFLALEFLVLGLLWLKTREESMKPEWMRDCAFTAPLYLIRTNYKTVTRYFWLCCCVKKVLLALAITCLYFHPSSAIFAVSTVQALFLLLSVYCEPYERRYLRIHHYCMEIMKLFIYLSLVNFTEKYVSYARMIQMTAILYLLLAIMFGFNFFFIALNILIERDWYLRALGRKFCNNNSEGCSRQGRLGYYSEGRLYIYERE